MNQTKQQAVIDLLASPATHGGAAVERIDTHISIVFLAGSRAFKLKRAVRFDYLDFSTPERRRELCDAEVRLNRRTAPGLYRGTVAVTRERDGSLALDGSGTPVEWLVEMRRFDQAALFDRLAAAGGLPLDLMPPLASAIAAFHEAAEPRPDHGGQAGMTWVIDGNAAGFAEHGAGFLPRDVCDRVTRGARAELARRSTLLERRRERGFVRHCHGDLHLRNIVLLDGRPTLFDGVEFNDEIACTDVLYDLAFLLMDLWRRRLPRHASAVWNRYLAETGDLEGVALLPLFLSCRAAVRAKTSATAAGVQRAAGRREELQALAREYLGMAAALLEPAPPCLIAVGGLSGSGKSTLAYTLAPSLGGVPGAVVLRSDEVRKRLLGRPLLTRLDDSGYTPEISGRVYATVAELAGVALAAGHSVIVDAVNARPEDRAAIERKAAEIGVPFAGLWLDAPESVLVGRATARRNDASDADARVVRMQRAGAAGDVTWHRLDASRPAQSVAESAAAVLDATLPAGARA